MVLARVLAGVLAVMLPAASPAQTADKPSFLKSLWSSVSRAVDRITPDGKDGGETIAPTEATPGQPAAPSLSSAHWIGFTPVIVASEATSEATGGDAWIAGPFAAAGDTAWVSDTVSGMTTEVRLVWRDAAVGSLAELSAEAGRELGLLPGAVANVTIYLAR